jgi:hypothetical protein
MNNSDHRQHNLVVVTQIKFTLILSYDTNNPWVNYFKRQTGYIAGRCVCGAEITKCETVASPRKSPHSEKKLKPDTVLGRESAGNALF